MLLCHWFDENSVINSESECVTERPIGKRLQAVRTREYRNGCPDGCTQYILHAFYALGVPPESYG